MELNKIHLDSDFNKTIVPVGQRFLFLGYLDGDQSTNEIVIRYKDSDGNFGNLSSDSEDTSIEIEREITEDNIQDGNIVLSNSAIPVLIKTSNNNIYPIEKNTLKEENGSFIIKLAAYLAYENTKEFVAPWVVYFGGGSKGEKGDKGSLNVVVSETEPTDPSDGMIWVPSV